MRPALPSLLGGEDLRFEAGSIMSAHGAKHASLRAAWQPLFFSGRRAVRGSFRAIYASLEVAVTAYQRGDTNCLKVHGE